MFMLVIYFTRQRPTSIRPVAVEKFLGGPMAAFLYPDPSQLKCNNVSVQW